MIMNSMMQFVTHRWLEFILMTGIIISVLYVYTYREKLLKRPR